MDALSAPLPNHPSENNLLGHCLSQNKTTKPIFMSAAIVNNAKPYNMTSNKKHLKM